MVAITVNQIRQLLDEYCDIDTSHIVIAVRHGHLILEGHVSSYPAIFEIIGVIDEYASVPVTVNHLTVRLPGEPGREDTDIAEDISNAVKRDKLISNSTVHYTVRSGVVTLSGVTDSSEIILRAEKLLANVKGLDSVLNQIRYSP